MDARCRVLVVEDDADVRAALAELLVAEGYAVAEAEASAAPSRGRWRATARASRSAT